MTLLFYIKGIILDKSTYILSDFGLKSSKSEVSEQGQNVFLQYLNDHFLTIHLLGLLKAENNVQLHCTDDIKRYQH